MLSHLNAGTGNPWAGQSNVKLSFTLASNPRLLSTVGNLGPELPTGSDRNEKRNRVNSDTPRTRKRLKLTSTLKKQTSDSSAALATILRTKKCHITEGHTVNNESHDNLKSHFWHHKAVLNIKIS